MRWPIVRAIFEKEIVEMIRDRRTLITTLVLPLVLYPLLFLVAGALASAEKAKLEAITPAIALWGEMPEPSRAPFEGELHPRWVEPLPAPPEAPAAAARELIAQHKAHVVLSFSRSLAASTSDPSDPQAPPSAGAFETWSARLYFDPVQRESRAVSVRVRQALEHASTAVSIERLARLGIPATALRPLSIEPEELATAEDKGADVAGSMLPYLLLMLIASAGFYASVDVTAGEKERGTLQTLLTAPLRAVEIVTGKYLAVLSITLVGTLCNLLSLALALARGMAGQGVSFRLDARAAAAIFVTMIPAALLIVGLFLAIGVFARSFREGQTYLTPVMLLIIVCAVATVMPGVEMRPQLAVVPLVNVALLVHELLLGRATAGQVAMVFGSSLAFAALAIAFAARVFESEQVLLSGERPFRDVLASSRRGTNLSTSKAVVFTALLLVAFFYETVFVDIEGHFARSQIITQLAIFSASAVVFTIGSGAPLRDTFSLYLPTRRGALGIALVAVSAWSIGVALWAIVTKVPAAQQYAHSFEEVVTKGTSGMGTPAAVVLLAVLPAIGEELCFRGVVLRGLAHSGSRVLTIAGSAIAFGLFHVNPFHAASAAALGLVFGFAVVESGTLMASVAAHFVNNAVGVLSTRYPEVGALLGSPAVVTSALVVCGTGLWLLRGSAPGSRPRQAEPLAASRADAGRARALR